MKQIRAIIVDGEEPLRAYLRSLLAAVWPDLRICGEAGNGAEALQLHRQFRPHIAFLDIRMPGLSGMEVAGEIAGTCRVVFVTAYDQYAVEAFDNAAVDYLLKPVSRERLERTVERLKERISADKGPPADYAEMVERLVAALSAGKEREFLQWVRVQQGDGVRLIPVDEVCYFQARDKYTAVLTQGEESLIRKPIKELVRELDPQRFWRIHRGTIVNARWIAEVSRSVTGRGTVRLKGRPETLPVSRSYIHIFKQM